VTTFHKYLCIDPSFFTKKKRIEKLPDVLTKLSTAETTIVLPPFFTTLLDPKDDFNEKIPDDEIEDLEIFKILQKIDPSLKNENDFFKIMKKTKSFLKKFHVTTSDKITSDFKTSEFSFKHLNEISKFGKPIVSTVTDFMIITSELQGTIVAYGKKFISLVRKIRIPAMEGYSNLKHKMINDGLAPKALKLIAAVHCGVALSGFVQAFDIVGIPVFPSETIDIMLIIANG
jgi:hypothetical protein